MKNNSWNPSNTTTTDIVLDVKKMNDAILFKTDEDGIYEILVLMSKLMTLRVLMITKDMYILYDDFRICF